MSTRLGGRYQIVREIGSGGMGRVFQAVDTETGRAVAAKVLIAGDEIDLQALLRFQQEGAVLSTLKHPNIVQVYGTHLEEHTSSIIMELLEGRSLTEILRQEQLSLPRIKHLMRQVAAALAFAHSRGIIHRDVKPDNIMVVGNDNVKVTDFGIARVLQEGGTLNTRTGTAIGTPFYMSPEQIEGQKVDGRSDIYSFGAVLYQTVTGHPPFEGEDPVTVAFKHVHRAPDPPSNIRADIPEDWEDLILGCLAKNPDDRPQSASALEEAVGELSTTVHARAVPLKSPIEGSVEVEAREREARARLEQGKSKEIAGELRSALGDYRAALTVAPRGPVRGELEAAIARVGAKSDGGNGAAAPSPPEAAAESISLPSATPAHGALPRSLPRRWLALGGGLVALAVVAIAALLIISGRSQNASPVAKPLPRSGAVMGGFSRPTAVSIDSTGNVYVSDTGNNRIQKLSSTGKSLGQWGGPGSATGQFQSPRGIGIDGQGNLFVADAGNNRIDKLAANGEPAAQWGTSGSGPGQFRGPEGVALDAQGNVYVADTGNSRIVKLSSSGRVLGAWGTKGSGAGQFDHPSGIAVDSQGNIYVADTGNNRVQKLSSSGTPLDQWGSSGSGAGQFNALTAITVDGQGNMYVADTGNDRVQMMAPTSDPLGKWSAGPAGPFKGPEGVALGPHGALYIADTGNNRVQKASTASASG